MLCGASGSGKSDLALRLIDEPAQAAGRKARLVSDDQTIVTLKGGRLLASPPASLQSRLEVRGLGIVKLPATRVIGNAPVVLLVDLVAAKDIERMPERARRGILGVSLPVFKLAPFEASAPARLRLALASLRAG